MIMLFDQEYAVNQYGKAQKREGWEKAQVSDIRTLMERLNLSTEAAMDALAVPAEEREKYTQKLKETEAAEQYTLKDI